MGHQLMPNNEDLIRARQRSRSRIMALLLGAFAVLMFGISIAKIRAGAVHPKTPHHAVAP
jgi:hypothetical protein